MEYQEVDVGFEDQQGQMDVGVGDGKGLVDYSESISSICQASENAKLCASIQHSGSEPFRHYWERVDTRDTSPLVNACIHGYSEGMLRKLSEEDIKDVLAYDETLGVTHRNYSQSPEWMVECVDTEQIQRPLNWVKRTEMGANVLHLIIIVDEKSEISDEQIIAHWAEAGVPAANISISHVDSELVDSAEFPWGYGWLFVQEYTANWLYWYWRGQKDQLARMTGDRDAWKRSCSTLDEMINDEARLYGFDPW